MRRKCLEARDSKCRNKIKKARTSRILMMLMQVRKKKKRKKANPQKLRGSLKRPKVKRNKKRKSNQKNNKKIKTPTKTLLSLKKNSQQLRLSIIFAGLIGTSLTKINDLDMNIYVI